MLANSHIAHGSVPSNQQRPSIADGPCNWAEEECGCEPDLHSDACVREQMRLQHARSAGLCGWCDQPVFRTEFCSGWCREQARLEYLACLAA